METPMSKGEAIFLFLVYACIGTIAMHFVIKFW